LTAFIAFCLFFSQFFIPYRRRIFFLMRLLQFAIIFVVALGILLANNYKKNYGATYLSVFTLVAGSVSLLVTMCLMLLSNLDFLRLQLRSIPAKYRILNSLGEKRVDEATATQLITLE
jgi:hypothetical protein